MSHWWRAYDEAVDDPKLILLSDKAHRAWFNLMCVASAYGGILPEIKIIAVKLRVTPQQASAIIAELVAAELVDRREAGGFEPHNWGGRQYQSDADTTASSRSKKYRDKKRNERDASRVTQRDANVDVTRDVTHESRPPETDTDTETDISEADASGADAPDPRTLLFRDGVPTLSRLTGKTERACRTFIGLCLKEADDDAVIVLRIIEDAERNRVSDPSAWISGCLKGRRKNGPSREVSTACDTLIDRLNAGFGGAAPQEHPGRGEGQTDARLLSYGRG